MKKTEAPKLRKRAAKRDLNAELLAAIGDAKAGRWARKTEFTRRADGGWRRRIVLADGTVEKDEVIPASASAQVARAGTGLSQAQFAKLIGVSLRTLQEWEQGRKRPSGPASALLRIVARDPQVVGALRENVTLVP
ncbi:MAG: helix-turn-helix domain-containing protein [Betaproteobacteria bacterium]|nr:helix-turn-helix domain-containing protein [Betaproteobacteria bacterium]